MFQLGSSPIYGEDIRTDNQQSAQSIRNPSRASSLNIDAAYYNPAGTIKLTDGFHFSLSNRSTFEKRSIDSHSPLYKNSINGKSDKKFISKDSKIFTPYLESVYKRKKWALSATISISKKGKNFKDGLPLFEMAGAIAPELVNKLSGITRADSYSLNQNMEEDNLIYRIQVGAAYEINSMFSIYGGLRLNMVNNKYEGYLKNLQTNWTPSGMSSPSILFDQVIAKLEANGGSQADINNLSLLSKAGSSNGARLESEQTGSGISPIIGSNFSYTKLNIGVKYEFKTSLNVENKIIIDDTGSMFVNGTNSSYDIPALFSIGASYVLLPRLNASISYDHYFTKQADLENDRQQYLSGGINQYAFGLEYQINKTFLVSARSQIIDNNATKEYQTELDFLLNSYTLGLGGAINVSNGIQINIGYSLTRYSRKEYSSEAKTNSYRQTKNSIGIGINYSF